MSGLSKLVGHKVLDYPTHLILNAMTPKPPKRRLGDIAEQTALEGGARPIVFGRVRPIGGNIIALQAPQRRFVKEKVQGGKGGGKKKKQKVEHVYRTYAIGICEGPVSAITRIWRNNKLVYDARGNAWGQRNNGVFLNQYRLYPGTYDQLPDPTLESIWGIGNMPAFRGTCYMVAVNEDLTELSGAVPQWTFEVERAEVFDIETDLYPLSEQERLAAGAWFSGGQMKIQPKEQERLHAGATLAGAVLQSVRLEYQADSETLNAGAVFSDAQLQTVLRQQGADPESIHSAAWFSAAQLQPVRLEREADTETLTTNAFFTGGSLQ